MTFRARVLDHDFLKIGVDSIAAFAPFLVPAVGVFNLCDDSAKTDFFPSTFVLLFCANDLVVVGEVVLLR